jgi:alkanesulfonate monooxygenase SsuD/methylene tetrahydromethanopterin reductase-like flavin-dependent oxidoreductase (luciferase family)
LPYHNPFTLAGRMMQLDYQTRGRAMFGVGPGSLVYDADKMGLKAEDQRRKLDESLDVIVELMAGRMVTKKTDWFDLREARLQLPSYSQPAMEMAVASARSPTGALQAGKHGIGMISIGGTSDDALKAHAANWGVYTEAARKAGKSADRSKWRIVTFAHVAETREQARADVRSGLRTSTATSARSRPSRSFRRRSPAIRPSISSRRARLHRHAGGLRAAFRAAVERLERRARRHPAAGAQLGRLGGDAALLRADGALRAPALPAQLPTRCATRATTTRRPSARPPAWRCRRRCRRRSTSIRRGRGRGPFARP